MTEDQALQTVANVFEQVQANKATHIELEKVLQFLKEKLAKKADEQKK